MSVISTPVTELFGIKHPVILAGKSSILYHDGTAFTVVSIGMDRASGPELVAAVTNAGGLGVLGAIRYNPEELRAAVCPSTAE